TSPAGSLVEHQPAVLNFEINDNIAVEEYSVSSVDGSNIALIASQTGLNEPHVKSGNINIDTSVFDPIPEAGKTVQLLFKARDADNNQSEFKLALQITRDRPPVFRLADQSPSENPL